MTTKQLLPLLISLLAITSCKTLEDKCAERFPQQVKETIIKRSWTDTIMIPVHTIEYIDTTECPPSDTPITIIKTKIVEVPGDSIPYEVMCLDTIVTNTDQAKINYLVSQVNASRRMLAEEKEAKRTRSWIITALSLALAVLLLLVVRGNN